MKLRNLAQFIHPRFRGLSVCEACGSEFTCGVGLAGCWCSEIKLSDAVRAELRASYERCLCRACLEKFAEAGRERNGSKEEQVFTGQKN